MAKRRAKEYRKDKLAKQGEALLLLAARVQTLAGCVKGIMAHLGIEPVDYDAATETLADSFKTRGAEGHRAWFETLCQCSHDRVAHMKNQAPAGGGPDGSVGHFTHFNPYDPCRECDCRGFVETEPRPVITTDGTEAHRPDSEASSERVVPQGIAAPARIIVQEGETDVH